MKVLTRDVRVLSTGIVKRKGSSVGIGEVPATVWQSWLDEGILTDDEDALIPPPDTSVRRQTALEEEGVIITRDEVMVTLDSLSKERLRQMAKDVGIPHWHLKSKESLVTELDRLRR